MAIRDMAISSAVCSDTGNRKPPALISAAIPISIRRRPMASPRQLATTLDNAPPAMMALNTSPACKGVNSSKSR